MDKQTVWTDYNEIMNHLGGRTMNEQLQVLVNPAHYTVSQS